MLALLYDCGRWYCERVKKEMGGEVVVGNKRTFVLIPLVMLIALVKIYAFYPSEYRKNFAELEQACAELTENDPDGRVYELIVGRYLASKVVVMTVPDLNFLSYIRMVFKKGWREFEVSVAVSHENKAEFHHYLLSVLGHEAVKEKKDTTKKYGICTFKNKRGEYLGAKETLRQISR